PSRGTDGTAVIDATGLPVAAAVEAHSNLERLAVAAKASGDPRTLQQLRADAALDLLRAIPFRTTPTIDPVTAQADTIDRADQETLPTPTDPAGTNAADEARPGDGMAQSGGGVESERRAGLL